MTHQIQENKKTSLQSYDVAKIKETTIISLIEQIQQIEGEMFLSKTLANFPTIFYPFQPSFDKQAVTEVNANLGSIIKI